MLNKAICGAAWSCLIFIIYATLSPRGLRPTLTYDEPFFVVLIERFGAYAVLGCLLSLAYPRQVAFVCFIVFGAAVALELLQVFIPGRHGRIPDSLEKLAGGAFGILMILWTRLATINSANKRLASPRPE